MSKIVINGVDGNFGSLVAKYALELMNKEDLVFTAPKEESLKEYKEQGIQIRLRIRRRKYLLHPIMQATYRIQRMEQTVLRELIQTIPRPQGWTLLHLKIMVQQVMVVLNLIRGQIRQ